MNTNRPDATPELRNKMASFSEPLTVDNIRKIWKTEFLPNMKKEIRNELKTEIEKVNCLITNLCSVSTRLNRHSKMIPF